MELKKEFKYIILIILIGNIGMAAAAFTLGYYRYHLDMGDALLEALGFYIFSAAFDIVLYVVWYFTLGRNVSIFPKKLFQKKAQRPKN
ncbi:hypothetical protein [Methanocella conradii]|uniref:hypothetical protein n=1 Tax=Methanocella conradii TaxID=1175444 RepID=UPI00157D99E7|nr:hypothetical protein [Methanocella conradii]